MKAGTGRPLLSGVHHQRRINLRSAHECAAAALIAAAILMVTAAPAPAATPGQNGKVVFTSGRDLNYEVYSMNGDGSVPVNLS